ncbi:hypothetical protein Tco_0884685, partial [Tanacetum coccineum]
MSFVDAIHGVPRELQRMTSEGDVEVSEGKTHDIHTSSAAISPQVMAADQVWISQKSQENDQKRASTDTRIRRVQSRSPKTQASVK